MAKNELLPFADGEDANVLPTNQWEALTDILENGFQSGIAKSEQVNRVLAQGAVASYVLGQLIVDQLNKDATLDKDTLYQNIVQALQENAKDACLPLSGGTMTGEIVQNVGDFIRCEYTNKYTSIKGGTNDTNGGSVTVYGKNHATNAGEVVITACDGTYTKSLNANPDGTLTWGGKHLVRSVNGTTADASGNANVYATIAPDLTAGVTVTSNFTAPSDGWLIGNVYASSYTEGYALINGKEFIREAQSYANFQMIVSKGDVLSLGSSSSFKNTYFYPFKGA